MSSIHTSPADSYSGELLLSISHVFFVTSWGYAGDHWFSWLVKALNSHPEIFSYLANEGSRPKYFPAERSRAERPEILHFSRFMSDVGMTYKAVGDCYSYRPTMMDALRKEWGDLVPVVQITRHPIAWLEFHVRWRALNMRMLGGEVGPIQHEFENACNHSLFKSLDLMPYSMNDIDVWASYQGMEKLNDVVADLHTGIRHHQLEKIVLNPKLFNELVGFITHNRVNFDQSLLDQVYRWVWRPFKGETTLNANPERLLLEWPDWKRTAFERIVSPEAIRCFQALGYEI
jgi:hypothetical protein